MAGGTNPGDASRRSDARAPPSVTRRSLLAGAAGVAGATAGCSLPTSSHRASPADAPAGEHVWPQFRYDRRNSGFHTDTTAPRGDVEVLWRHPTDPPTPVLSSPVAVDGVVHVGTQDSTHLALNARTGGVVWEHRVVPEAGALVAQTGSAVRTGDSVYVGTPDLYELDARTGEERWTFAGGEAEAFVRSSPTLAGGRLYVAARSHVVALAPDDGTVAWTYPTGSRVERTPAVGESTVFATDESGTLYALDAATGSPTWTRTFAPAARSSQPPVLGHGRVYVGTDDGALVGVDAATGETEWRYPNGIIGSTPPVATDVALVVRGGEDDGHLAALDPATGEPRWTYAEGGVVYSHLVATPETVVGTKGGRLTAHDAATGERLWRVDVGMPGSDPAVADGTVYVGGARGVVAVGARG